MSIQGVNLNSPLTYLPPVKTNAQTNAAAASTGSTTTPPTSGTGTGLTNTVTGTTFLNLLVKELQNQDPSAPMDSTAMVGQMISLNQLDQLIGINQAVGGTTDTSGASSATAAASGAGSAANSQPSAQLMAARTALENDASPANSVNAASLAASNPNTTLDLTNLTNQMGSK